MWQQLQSWFLENSRDFPWRNSPSPYHVWISEVMLQQTQAARVIDYYQRFLVRFPSVQALGDASIDEVLKVWEGLGYYSRARSLHAAALEICKRFDGKIPDNPEALGSIKGLGPYTIGAILSFGFKQKQPAVDGNVMRVLTRYFAISDDISKAKTVKQLRELTLSLLPDKDAHIITEALIELGATLCRPKPLCTSCPLQSCCKSYKAGTQDFYPVKSSKVQYERLFREVAVICCRDKYLIRQGRQGIACTGLYEFPYFDCLKEGLPYRDVQKLISKELGLKATFNSYLDEERHSFTRYRVTLYPKLFFSKEETAVPAHHWCTLDVAQRLTFSSGHKRLLLGLLPGV